MHARHRSPGSGIRSGSVGLGGLTATRISSEGSMRVHGMYNSEHRYSRGFGRGPPKPYLSLPPPRKGDIFMEAGRLAAEYLVFQGVLSPNVLPGKCYNSSLKNQSGDFLEFRAQDRENMQLHPEGRTSALARLGDVVPDASSARRRFPDEFSITGLRNHVRGRKRMGAFRGHVSEWGRENGMNGLWSDKARASPDADGEDGFVTGCHEEKQTSLDGTSGTLKVVNNELPSEVDFAGESESDMENYKFPDDPRSNASSFNTSKEPSSRIDGESSKGSDDIEISNPETKESKDVMNNDEPKKQSVVEDFSLHHQQLNCGTSGKNSNDLLRLCNFAKVPTRTRSSLTGKGSKVESVPIIDDRSTCEGSSQEGPKVHIEESPVEKASSGMLTNQTHSPKCFGTDDVSGDPSIQSVEDVGDLDTVHLTERGECMGLQSFPDTSVTYEQALGQGLPGLGGCSSMVKERGEKRAVPNEDTGGETKKPREWVSSMVAHGDGDFDLHNFNVKASDSGDQSLSCDEEVIDAIDQERLPSVALYPNIILESGVEFREEKQLFPSSFKICDLNLMGSSDMTEIHERNPILSLPSTSEAKNEVPVDVDLSISNNCNRCSDFGRRSTAAEEVVVVDLEDNTTEGDDDFATSESKRTETVPSTMECFPNHMASTGDLPDAQDGYGLMISELLGTDISNCSSVPAEISGLHTEIGLHNGAGILGDDDPIYLSLGEIPISFLGVWEQPTQQYEKPF